MNENEQKLDELLKSFVQTDEQKAREKLGRAQREAFIKRFPIERISDLTPETYCIGHGDHENFCWWIERGTKEMSYYSPGSSMSYGMYWEKDAKSYRLSLTLQSYRDDHPDASDETILKEVIAKPLQKFISAKGVKGALEASRCVGMGLLLKLLILYYPDEFFQVNSTVWIDTIIRAYDLDSPDGYVDKNRVLRRFYEKKKNLTLSGELTQQTFVGIVARQLGLAKPRFWHMQLHPGSDAEFSRENVLEILNKYAVVGMGAEWENDGGQPRQFEEDVHEGDIIGIREKGFVALVRVTGACRKNKRQNKLNWFDIVRPIEILSVDADDYIARYREETGKNAHNNLYNPATLSEVKPKCKNKFLRFWYDSVMGLNDTDDEKMDLRVDSELSNAAGGIEAKYSKEKFLDEVFMSSQQYDELVGLLRRKKNIILRGAPGVGKTYAARRLAYSLIGNKDKTRTGFVQFHQSYSYENFIRGYKPTANGGFELRDGVFLEFCKKAEEHPDNEYFFIIDEINRGNLSKIFGELLVLIEGDKRGQSDYAVKLAYGDGVHDERFCVPSNLYLIGLMNTADRSLAMIDYALRRRFAFFTVEPALDNPKFRKPLTPELDRLVSAVEILNKTIEDDPSLGKGFKIGHSYFCEKSEDGKLPRAQEVLDYEIAPTLEEYWFEDPAKAQKEIENLRKAIHA